MQSPRSLGFQSKTEFIYSVQTEQITALLPHLENVNQNYGINEVRGTAFIISERYIYIVPLKEWSLT